MANLSLLLFWFVRTVLKIECKRIFDSCVSLFSYQGSCQFLTALIFYHIVLSLSRTFFIFYRSFFLLSDVVVFATAILDYHIFFDLSTTFLTFFHNNWKFHFLSYESPLPVVSISLLQQLRYLIISFVACQQLFSFLFHFKK